MGLLALNRLISVRRDRRRRPIQGRACTADGLVTSAATTKDSACPRDDNSLSQKKSRYSGPSLPEDIWHHIHSLLPLQDAARVACVSHSFRSSWTCYPSLTITSETLGLEDEMSSNKISTVLARVTNHILTNHSGVGIKALDLQINGFPIFTTSSDVDRWLRIAVKPGIEKLRLCLLLDSRYEAVYNFPYSHLLGGSGKSIQHLILRKCALRPTAGLGCLSNLTSLTLFYVHITGDDLRCLLSSSVALVELTLVSCNEIIFLEIPSLLQRLSRLDVHNCKNLEVIESRSPDLYSFRYAGGFVRLSLGDSLQNFSFFESSWEVFHYACKNHPHMVPNLKDVDVILYVRDTPVVPVRGKFLQLRKLYIEFSSPDYDHLSLVTFLDACPSLETFILFVEPAFMAEESVLVDFAHDLRHMPRHLHRNIKDVQITGFCSTKSMVELTCYILENAKSLQCLTLSTLYNSEISCSNGNTVKCFWMSRDMIMKANKALLVVERYIVGKVPSSVELKVFGPCSRCNPLEI